MTTTTTKNPERILIIGKRWFQKSFGNTYHTARIIVDGVEVDGVGRTYGYGDQYLYSAFEKLEASGAVTPRERYANGGLEPVWQWAERNNVSLTYSADDVSRKKDL